MQTKHTHSQSNNIKFVGGLDALEGSYSQQNKNKLFKNALVSQETDAREMTQ